MNLDEFQKFVQGRKSISEKELLNLLHNFPDSNSNGKLQNEYYLIRCTKDEMREDDFIDLLLSKIVRYVLKREEYLPKGISREKQVDISWQIVDRARKQFVEDIKSGEIGELALFVILESKNIVQVLNKMNLKMSRKMHIHGLDAIHLQVNNGDVILHYGEAKTYVQFRSALKKAISDLTEFHSEIDNRKTDLHLVTSYIDTSKFEKYAEKVKDFINPYTRKKENFGTCNSIFIGYNWDELCNLSNNGDGDLTEYIVKKYQSTHKELSAEIAEEVKKSKISDKRFNFFLMPFTDIKNFREKFLKEIGKNVKSDS